MPRPTGFGGGRSIVQAGGGVVGGVFVNRQKGQFSQSGADPEQGPNLPLGPAEAPDTGGPPGGGIGGALVDAVGQQYGRVRAAATKGKFAAARRINRVTFTAGQWNEYTGAAYPQILWPVSPAPLAGFIYASPVDVSPDADKATAIRSFGPGILYLPPCELYQIWPDTTGNPTFLVFDATDPVIPVRFLLMTGFHKVTSTLYTCPISGSNAIQVAAADVDRKALILSNTDATSKIRWKYDGSTAAVLGSRFMLIDPGKERSINGDENPRSNICACSDSGAATATLAVFEIW